MAQKLGKLSYVSCSHQLSISRPKLLACQNFTLTQKCYRRDIDYFGFKISRDFLGTTLKEQRIPPVTGYSNLKTHTHRMPPKLNHPMDLSKFAKCTLTERKFAVQLPDEYTIEPIRKFQSGGRDPNTGRIAIHKRGGGKKKWFHWIDFYRLGPSEEDDLEEKVLWIGRDLCRTAFFALVANGTDKRYVLAHDGMQVGDIIRSTRHIPLSFGKIASFDHLKYITECTYCWCLAGPLREGDAHPVGALPAGTMLCQLEVYPRYGASKCRAAGSHATIVQHMQHDMVLIQLTELRQIIVSKHCMAVVGRMSRTGPRREIIGSGARRRWMGLRSASGWKKKKTGRFGRKLNKKKLCTKFDPNNPYFFVSKAPLACRKWWNFFYVLSSKFVEDWKVWYAFNISLHWIKVRILRLGYEFLWDPDAQIFIIAWSIQCAAPYLHPTRDVVEFSKLVVIVLRASAGARVLKLLLGAISCGTECNFVRSEKFLTIRSGHHGSPYIVDYSFWKKRGRMHVKQPI